MTFPTVPTVAAGRVITGTQANSNAVKVFPDLSGLTKSSGDLLIAIVFQYGASVTNAFGSWTTGWTQFLNSTVSGGASMAAAYKWSDGTETGQITVTQGGTVGGQTGMMLLSIPGADSSTPPEASTGTRGTSANADPDAVSPSWGAADNLWIAYALCGETSTTGSFTGMGSAPTGFSSFVNTGISADVSGGVDGAVAFLQANAATEDPGTFTNDTSNTRWGAGTIVVRPSTSTVNSGSAAANVTITGAASGSAVHAGSASASATVTGAASGASVHSGSAAASVTVTGAANGTAPAIGANSGSATAHVTVTGSASGSAAHSGSATASVGIASTATGSRASTGSATAAVTVTGAANGTAPSGGTNSGTATAHVTITGSASGSTVRSGSASASVSITGMASGVAVHSGSAAASVTVTASAAGPTPPITDPSELATATVLVRRIDAAELERADKAAVHARSIPADENERATPATVHARRIEAP